MNRRLDVALVVADVGEILIEVGHSADVYGVTNNYGEVLSGGFPGCLLPTQTSSPSEDYLAVLAGQRQWIATTNFAGCPGRPQIALRIAPCSLPRRSS